MCVLHIEYIFYIDIFYMYIYIQIHRIYIFQLNDVWKKHHLEKLDIQMSFRRLHIHLLKLDITATYQVKSCFYLFGNF